jgi:hypothetical protein
MEAIADPAAFLEDLATGKVGAQPDPLFPSAEDEDDDDEDDEDGEDDEAEQAAGTAKMEVDGGSTAKRPATRTWSRLPRPQAVVRCPPINWSQYAVVGESLDKLHADQVANPSEGVPAVFGSGSTYEFKAEFGGERQKKYVGVAAPYTPGKDKIDKKVKAKK